MEYVKITRIDNFTCPLCGEIIKQVSATDGVVKGWCRQAGKEIKVVVSDAQVAETTSPINQTKASHLDTLKQKREKVLKEVVSAREDGDLKENSAYHAAREQMSILDDKIKKEEARIKRSATSK